MRVGVVHMTTAESSAGYSGMIEKNLDRVKASGTQLEHRYVKHLRRATDSSKSFPMMLNQGDIVAEVVALITTTTERGERHEQGQQEGVCSEEVTLRVLQRSRAGQRHGSKNTLR